jgi:hypothetical protein
MKTTLLISLLFFCSILCLAQGTTQVIGEVPGISGGFEDMITTPVYDNAAFTSAKTQ